MQTVNIIIERAGDDHYTCYADNVEGVYGAGDTIDEAKQSAQKAIRLLKENNKPENIPAILKDDYSITYTVEM